MTQILKAGDRAPADGLYRVTHYQHRLPHTVSVVHDTVLPACLKCGFRVHFELIGNDGHDPELHRDKDFPSEVS